MVEKGFEDKKFASSTGKPMRLTKEQKKEFLAKRLREELKQKNIPNAVFANAIGKSSSEVSKWLSGRHNFTIETLFAIEDYLQIDFINIGSTIKPVLNGVKTFSSVEVRAINNQHLNSVHFALYASSGFIQNSRSFKAVSKTINI